MIGPDLGGPTIRLAVVIVAAMPLSLALWSLTYNLRFPGKPAEPKAARESGGRVRGARPTCGSGCGRCPEREASGWPNMVLYRKWTVLYRILFLYTQLFGCDTKS
jgi:hypothetical protein